LSVTPPVPLPPTPIPSSLLSFHVTFPFPSSALLPPLISFSSPCELALTISQVFFAVAFFSIFMHQLSCIWPSFYSLTLLCLWSTGYSSLQEYLSLFLSLPSFLLPSPPTPPPILPFPPISYFPFSSDTFPFFSCPLTLFNPIFFWHCFLSVFPSPKSFFILLCIYVLEKGRGHSKPQTSSVMISSD